MSQKTTQSQPQSILSTQTIILASIVWGLLALFIFLLGSPIVPRPLWYLRATYLLENTSFFAAMMLCLRNWRSPKIVSGRTVWLSIGMGMLCYFIANLLFGWWESVLGLAPDVSPADFLYLLSYLLLGLGMLLAVLSKQLNLSGLQWGIVGSIAVVGIILAYFVSGYASGASEATQPAKIRYGALTHPIAQIQPAPVISLAEWVAQAEAPAQAPAPPAEGTEQPEATEPGLVEQPAVEDTASPDQAVDESSGAVDDSLDGQADEAIDPLSDVPSWMVSLNDQLAPFSDVVWVLYLAGDTFLVVMATMLLLAFWGGRFSISWRFIAAAGLSFYIADMWYYYAIGSIENYETGALPEVFWIFSGVLLCIGAALEYSLSTRSRRGRRRTA